jgi:hypothetical protein
VCSELPGAGAIRHSLRLAACTWARSVLLLAQLRQPTGDGLTRKGCGRPQHVVVPKRADFVLRRWIQSICNAVYSEYASAAEYAYESDCAGKENATFTAMNED